MISRGFRADAGPSEGSRCRLEVIVTSRGAIAGSERDTCAAGRRQQKSRPPHMGTSGVMLVVPPHFAVRRTAFACTTRAQPRDAVAR